MLLRTLPFCVYSVFHSKFFAFNRLRTLSQNTGGGMGFFPFWFTLLAPSSEGSRLHQGNSLPSHHSPITNQESRISRSVAYPCRPSRNDMRTKDLQPIWNHIVTRFLAPKPFGCTSLRKTPGAGGSFLRIWRGMRTPRSAAPRGLSDFVSRYACSPLSTFNPQPLYLPTFFLLLLSFPLSSEVSLCRLQL